MGRRVFFLLSMMITFPRFNRPRGETSRALVPGFARFAYLLFYPGSHSRFGGRYKLASQLLLFARAGARPALKPSVKVLCRPSLILQQRALQKVPVEFKNMATTRTGRTSPPLLDARSWTEAEDDAVRAAVASHGKRAWTDVARDVSDAFPGRPKTSKQCRARWVASLDPKITTRPWTEAEERIIRESQAEVGNKWATIAKR